MNFDSNTISDFILVYACSELSHRAHVLMAGCEILIEGKAALNPRGEPFGDNLYVRSANGNSVNPHQDLCGTWLGNGFFHQA
jgi:hypothetical protein